RLPRCLATDDRGDDAPLQPPDDAALRPDQPGTGTPQPGAGYLPGGLLRRLDRLRRGRARRRRRAPLAHRPLGLARRAALAHLRLGPPRRRGVPVQLPEGTLLARVPHPVHVPAAALPAPPRPRLDARRRARAHLTWGLVG